MLNAAQVNWYWIPPKPHQKHYEEEPLVLDHVFSYDQGKKAWANVHTFDHGELLTGQMRLLHQPPPQPPPTTPPTFAAGPTASADEPVLAALSRGCFSKRLSAGAKHAQCTHTCMGLRTDV